MDTLKAYPGLTHLRDVSGGLQLAVIGCGAWGKNLVRCFAQLGCLGAVVDRQSATVETLLHQYGGRALSFEQVLAEPSIQAVAISTQPATHHDLAKRALLAGKHLFVEKPFALELKHAEELTDLARRMDRRLMVGHILQYHPAFSRLQSLVASGAVGRILRLHANRMNLGAIRSEEDVLWCLGPHDLSMILTLVRAEPSEVYCIGGYHLRKTIADAVTVHLVFPAGEQAQINLSWLHPVKEHRLTVIGSEAMMVLDDGAPWERKLLLYPHIVNVAGRTTTTIRAEPITVAIEQDEPLKLECQHFVDCIAHGRDPITNGDEGLRVTRVLAEASMRMSPIHGCPASPVRTKAVHPAPKARRQYARRDSL